MSNCPPVILDSCIIDNYNLSPLAGWLYVVIARHVNADSGEGFPSVVRLAKLANMSRASVIRYIKELEAVGLIKVTRRNNGNRNENNVYELLTQTPEVSQSNHRSITKQPEITPEENSLVSDVDHKQIQEDIHVLPDQISNKDSVAPKKRATVPAEKPKRQPNPMYDAIKRIWQYVAAMNALMAKMLSGTATRAGWREYNLETPIGPDELLEWAAWYRKTALGGDSKLNMVEDRAKIQSSITYWQQLKSSQAQKAHLQLVERNRYEGVPLGINQFVQTGAARVN